MIPKMTNTWQSGCSRGRNKESHLSNLSILAHKKELKKARDGIILLLNTQKEQRLKQKKY